MKGKMRVIVLCDKAGNIQSVAMLNPALPPGLHVEIEGGGAVHELDLEADAITPDELLGKKGPESRERVYETLRRLIPQPSTGRKNPPPKKKTAKKK
jgi:hypothetical protein